MNKRNILVFQTDDHGQWAMGCYGNREIHAPTMDWLARDGVRCANAFTPCPVCSPARASFWTGALPSAHGVHDHLDEQYTAREHPGVQEQSTLASALRRAGYYTGLSGKWHCGQPWRQPDGFDVWFTSAKGTNSKFGPQEFHEGGRGTVIKGNGHQAPYYTDRALRFLRERPADQPFFLYVGYTNTHGPFTGEPPRLVAQYRDATFGDIPDEAYPACHGVPRGAPSKTRAQDREALAQYYAGVSAIDEQMGRLLDELANQGVLDNTVIVYTSDHGHMNWHHRLFGKGNATVPQNFFEESIRVPLLLRAPGLVPPSQTRTELVDHCDLHATLLDAAGAPRPTHAGLPGRSLWPALCSGQPAERWRTAQCCEYGNARMILRDGLKLVVRYPGPNGQFPDELYDLTRDPRETRNCIDEAGYAARVATMRQDLDAHFAQYELPAHRGRDIERQRRCNPDEPWLHRVQT